MLYWIRLRSVRADIGAKSSGSNRPSGYLRALGC